MKKTTPPPFVAEVPHFQLIELLENRITLLKNMSRNPKWYKNSSAYCVLKSAGPEVLSSVGSFLADRFHDMYVDESRTAPVFILLIKDIAKRHGLQIPEDQGNEINTWVAFCLSH